MLAIKNVIENRSIWLTPDLPEYLLQVFTGGIFQSCQHGVQAAQAVGCYGNRCHVWVALFNIFAASKGGCDPQ